jgi:uncharacterized protein YkwD
MLLHRRQLQLLASLFALFGTNGAQASSITDRSVYVSSKNGLMCAFTNAARMEPNAYAAAFNAKINCPTKAGLGPMYQDTGICTAALEHSKNMAQYDCMEHDTCGPCTQRCKFYERLKYFYPEATAAAENVASGYRNALKVTVRPPIDIMSKYAK